MAKKDKKASKKPKSELTYFLDHPDIKRHPSPGNGNSPTAVPNTNVSPSTVRSGNMAGSVKTTGGPSIASQIGFGGK